MPKQSTHENALRIEHPFIIADNRHYTFYIWRKLFKVHDYAKYVHIPVYLVCMSALFKSLGTFIDHIFTVIWRMAHNSFAAHLIHSFDFAIWAICTVVALVPTPLMEFRYYIQSFYFLCLLTMNSEFLSKAGNEGTKRAEKGSNVRDIWSGIPIFFNSLFYAIVNAVTIVVFLYFPFEWSWEPGMKQRFMWWTWLLRRFLNEPNDECPISLMYQILEWECSKWTTCLLRRFVKDHCIVSLRWH